MSKPIYLHIPEPCHENWEAMSPVQQGRFCESCSKKVVDFSTMSDNQILEVLSKAAGKTCGRFSSDQLQRPVVAAIPPLLRPRRMLLSAFIPAFIISATASAQEKKQAKVVANQPIELVKLMGDTVMSVPGEAIIRGRVIYENTMPAVGATVIVDETKQKAVSDEKGNFVLPCSADNQRIKLTVSYMGYDDQKVEVERKVSRSISITLYQQKAITVGMIATRIWKDEEDTISNAKPATKVTVKGRVISRDGDPVPHATIQVKSLKRNITADSAGIFSLTDWMDRNSDHLTVSAPGYKGQITKVDYSLYNEDMLLVLDKKLAPQKPALTCEANQSLQGFAGGLYIVKPVTVKDTAATFIRKVFKNEMFTAYPNPVAKGSVISLSFKKPGEYVVMVFDNSGKLYLQKDVKTENKMQSVALTIPVTMSAGIYYIKATNTVSNQQFVDKLMIK